MNRSSIWPAWVSRCLKMSKLAKDQDFLKKLAQVVFNKSQKHRGSEELIRKKAFNIGLKNIEKSIQS